MIRRSLLGWILALAAVAPALAQAPGPEGEDRGEMRPRDEAFKMVDAYIVSNLQESLGLTDEQFVRVLPLVKRLQTERRETIHRRQQMLRDLRRLLRSGTATEAQVTEILREVKAIEADEPARTRKNLEAIDAALTPIQQAKFRVLEEEVAQKIREIMGQMRRQGRPGRLGDHPE